MQDARQFIANRKRQGISDARQLLLHRRTNAGPAAPLEVAETLPVVSDPLVPLVLPQKVITNDRYQPPPPARIDLEYAVPAPPVRRGGAPRGAGTRRGYFSQPTQMGRRRPPAQPAPQTIVRQPLRQPRQYYEQQGEYSYPAPEEADDYDDYYEDAGLGDNGYDEVIDVDDQRHFEQLYDDDDDYADVEEEAEPLPVMLHRYQQPGRYQPPLRRRYDEQLQFDYDYAAAAGPAGNGASVLSRRHRQDHRPVIAATATAAAAAPRAPRPSRSGASASTPVYRYEAGDGGGGGGGGQTYGMFDADGDVEMIDPERRRHRSRSPQLSRPSVLAAAAAAAAASGAAQSRARHRPSSSAHQQHLPPSASSARAAAAPTASASTAASTAAAQSRRSVDEVIKAYKVSISGLHHSVTRDDIYELFSSVGSVRKCSMLGSGRAEVVFPVRAEAETAVRRYNNRELDGVPMRLQISMVGIRLQSARGSDGK